MIRKIRGRWNCPECETNTRKEINMKVDVRIETETLCEATPVVTSTAGGLVCLALDFAGGKKKRCFMSPEAAVMLWRCFSGESVSCLAEYRTVQEKDAVPEKIAVAYVDKGTVWNVVMPKERFLVNADQALALAWAIKKCVAEALSPSAVAPKTKEIALSPVWTLTSRRVLTGDSAAEGADLVGGHVEVFSSKEKAEDRLREFMRPLVNEAHPADSLDGAETNVDDILDGIIEEVQHLGNSVWTRDHYYYDGTTQSFVVELENKDLDAVEI